MAQEAREDMLRVHPAHVTYLLVPLYKMLKDVGSNKTANGGDLARANEGCSPYKAGWVHNKKI